MTYHAVSWRTVIGGALFLTANWSVRLRLTHRAVDKGAAEEHGRRDQAVTLNDCGA
jgi:hypothetical protein